MASVINYKFRCMKDYSTILIEGGGIPLWELKSEIISQRKMQSKDFDLIFYDGHTNEKIVDEYYQVERNSHIVIERIPLWMSSTGYNVRDKKKEQPRIQKYKATPPDSYVCFRCGNKGHFIQHCPTNEDKAFDITRIRKPSGIPRDFLVPVDEGEVDADTGMLVTTEGHYVKAQPQVQEWKRNKIRSNTLISVPDTLKCYVCSNLFSNPVRTNCKHAFCRQCVSLNSPCPLCGVQIRRLDEDHEKYDKVNMFLNR